MGGLDGWLAVWLVAEKGHTHGRWGVLAKPRKAKQNIARESFHIKISLPVPSPGFPVSG